MSKIVRHSYGIKTERDELELNRMAYADRQRREDAQFNRGIDQRVAVKESRVPEENFIRSSMDRAALERKIPMVSNAINQQGKLYVFKDILAECFINSLWLDNYVIEGNTSKFVELISEYVDEHGGYAMLESAIKANPKIHLLKEIKSVCESTAHDTTKRIIKEMHIEPELANFKVFEMNDQEKDVLSGKRTDLNLDKLSQLVKDKVLTVVKDERDRQSKEKELMDDLENGAKEILAAGGTPTEKKPVMGEGVIKETTLFNAIFQNSLYEATVAVTERFVAYKNDEDDSSDDSGADTADTENVLSTEDFTSPVHQDVDIDLVMCEAITFYTLLELGHTICLETFTQTDIRNLTHKLIRR